MPSSSKSSVRDTPRPVNVFYVWYSEICRRQNTTPLSIVKPPKLKSNTVLDFICDRIKPEEWIPVLKALEKDTSLHVIAIRSRAICKFLHEVDTEDKLRKMKRRFGCLWTAYTIKTIVKSVSAVLKRSQVLASLELDGLPLTAQHMDPLIQGLRQCNTIRVLSLQHCPIKDIGCQQLCLALRFVPNVEVLNISGCELSSLSGEYIAKVIKYQQINRYCESWHNSLRYEDPKVENMRGLKRITLNNNPHFGDEGLVCIIDELEDDLWIKALDMQKCGITENIANRLLDLIEYSRSLEIADFRHNDKLSSVTLERIFEILGRKNFGYNPEFQWCLTTSTLYPDNFCNESTSCNSYNSQSVQKSKSAPFKPIVSSKASGSLRRTKTSANVKKRPLDKSYASISMEQAKKECVELNNKLKEEITKRQEFERMNDILKKKLDTISSVGSININHQVSDSLQVSEIPPIPKESLVTMAVENVVLKSNGLVQKVSSKEITQISISKAPYVKNGMNGFKSHSKVSMAPKKPDQARRIFEGLLYKDGMVDDNEDVNMQEFFDLGCSLKSKSKVAVYLDTKNDKTLDELSVSNISLQKFIEEMKSADDSLDSEPPAMASSRISAPKGLWNNTSRTRSTIVKVR